MADSKISDLAAASALAAADIAPVVQGGANVKATVQQIITAATGATGTNGETVTTSKPRVDLTQTWNAAGTTFTGFKLNVTDTESAAGSLLADFQVDGVSRAFIGKTGIANFGQDITNRVRVGYNVSPPAGQEGMGLWAIGGGRLWLRGYANLYFGAAGRLGEDSVGGLGWASSAAGTFDLTLYRDAANTLAQRNGVNAQTFRLYGTFTDASNSRRLALRMTTGGVASIKPEGLGTGSSGNVLHISGLPTSDPGTGILWNDGGIVKVGV